MKNKFLALLLPALLLVACGGGSGTDQTVVIEGDFSIAYVQRDVDAVGNPTDGIVFQPGGDLFIKNLASPSSDPVNVTGVFTNGEGDVSDPEVSYDGKKLLFAMRGPNDETWNIWEYDIADNELSRKIQLDTLANEGDDVDPHYLPDGRIVFASNRQEKSQRLQAAAGIQPYAGRDEYEREEAITLHVLDNPDAEDPNGQKVRQISFNPSHDRNPTVLMSGQIMVARWDHFANRNHFPLFTMDPDGSNIFVQYGSFSPGNSLLHPREMPDGRVMSSLMPLSGTHEGGALMVVDVKNFSENNAPANDAATGNGQVQATTNFDIPIGDEISQFGRYSTPYPLWDGTNRALVAFTTTPTIMVMDPMTNELVEEEAPPTYGIFMFDLNEQDLRPIQLPSAGKALTDPVAVQERPVPNVIPDKPNIAHDDEEVQQRIIDGSLDAGSLAARGVGILNVKSVYDTDSLNIMSDRVLVEGETIPALGDKPDLAMLKDPALTMAAQRPARFVRFSKAVLSPGGMSMDIIGESDFEMQAVVGYAQVEPDGSIRVEVPADTPLALAVLDADGRAFQTHTNWLQVRPGETRTCNGCHSPRRGSALNAAPIAGDHPNSVLVAESGESMAETRTRLSPAALELTDSVTFTDVWTDTNIRPADPDLTLDYSGLSTPAPTNGVINYAEHIQPLWTVDRASGACTSCHTGAAAAGDLDLSDGPAESGRSLSYDELAIGDPMLDENGEVITSINDDGEVVIERETALIEVGSSGDSSRSAHLVERLYEQELRAPQEVPAAPGQNHAGMLNASELFLVATWIDIGAQFRNDPFIAGGAATGGVFGGVKALSKTGFASAADGDSVHETLISNCQGCHQPTGNPGSSVTESAAGGSSSSSNGFVLTGNLEGDFNLTTAMINNVCTPAQNPLLTHPTSDNPAVHPQVLAESSAAHQKILAWINDGAANSICP